MYIGERQLFYHLLTLASYTTDRYKSASDLLI